MTPNKTKVKPCPPLTRRRQQAIYVNFMLRAHGLEQKDIAAYIGVTGDAISRVIHGRSTSHRIQKYIADTLNFENWDALLCSAPFVGGEK